ncbi:MAG TPA: YihY/virulence factor BrkB family protein [Acidimicrobiales bacterium]
MQRGERTGPTGEVMAVAGETWRRFRDRDEVLTGAGVAFFALLSIVPALAALVAVYGIFADPTDIADEIADLFGADAGPGRRWLLDELQRLTASSAASLGVAAVAAVIIALWSASSGVRHLLDAIDAAVGRPRLGWVRARTRGLLGVLAVVLVSAIVVAVMGIASGAPDWIGWLRFPVAFVIVLLGCAVLYRRAGARGATPPGAVVAAVLWAAGSIGLTAYLTWGPDLEAAYGALASVVAVMLWLWFSAMALLVGAHVTAVVDERDGPA